MAIEFTNKPIKWTNEGTAPSEDLKTNGFQAGYKPPAAVFNNQWHTTGECIDELQTKLSGVDDKKVDKADGKSLIDENVANAITYNSNYIISNNGIQVKSGSVYVASLQGDVMTDDIDETTKTPRMHCLSKKANSSDVLTKTNTTTFTPTGDYNPATKKYVDDKVGSITVPIIDNLESDSTTSALSAKQGKVLGTAIAAKVDKKGAVALIDEYLTYGLPDDVTWNYSLYLSYVLAVLNGKTSPQSTFAIPIGNGDLELGFAVKKGHLILKEGSVCVDNGDVAVYTNGTVHKLSNKIDKINGKSLSTNDYTDAEKAEVAKIKDKVDKVSGKGLSTNDFTNTYKTKLDNLDTNLNAKVINGSSLSSLTLTVSSTIPTTLAAGTICFIPEA